jgi:hypothetical protein
LISLANTAEPIFLVNRPGNVPSHSGAAPWLDKAITLCEGVFDEIMLRGDTDFSLTSNFDRWTERKVKFIFGMDAHCTLVALADDLPEWRFRPLPRRPRYEVKTEARDRRENVRERIVKEKEYENIRLQSEQVAEFMYQPVKCRQAYRVVVLRKNLSVEKGERRLFDDTRYFFYITNDLRLAMEDVVYQANERCNQENLIEQLKNGVNAMRVPAYDLNSNWAYMVIASLAWTLKAWFALTLPRAADREEMLRMEFKRFLHAVMLVPCQVIRGGHRILLRLVVEKDFWACWTLSQLFGWPDLAAHLIFKGGTSLSKVYGAIRRFSEDVDVSLGREWLGFGGGHDPERAKSSKQRRERLEKLSGACQDRIRDVVLPGLRARARETIGAGGWDVSISPDDPQTVLFHYPVSISGASPTGYLRPEVKIEAGARSDDWPAEMRTLRPYVANAYADRIPGAAVSVRVLSAERTFWEKATILHAEAHRDPAKATPARHSRHYSDLAVLAEHEIGRRALADDGLRARVVAHKQVFFAAAWARYDTAVPGTFRLIPDQRRLADLERDYRDMREMFFEEPAG